MSVVSSDTQFFSVEKDSRDRVKLILADVYQSLREKGYNPVNQPDCRLYHVRRSDVHYQP